MCKLQIGLFGDINKWQSKLDGIANKYDTADEEGLHGVYTGVCGGVSCTRAGFVSRRVRS